MKGVKYQTNNQEEPREITGDHCARLFKCKILFTSECDYLIID